MRFSVCLCSMVALGCDALNDRLMQGLVPVIQKERPEMMPKLAKMSGPMTEILAETTKACEPSKELD